MDRVEMFQDETLAIIYLSGSGNASLNAAYKYTLSVNANDLDLRKQTIAGCH